MIGLSHKEGREEMLELPKERNEALRVVYDTMIVLRQQLNKALGCKLKSGDLQWLTDVVMASLDKKKYKKQK
jgi:hypothetical protein